MTTCIDVGNSAVKIAGVTNGLVGDVVRIPTDPIDVDALQRAVGTADMVAMVSVVPAWNDAIRELCRRTGRELVEADAQSIPLDVGVDRPRQVGADRLLGAWTALERFGAPVVVVDAGTATTIDVVDADGVFVGGAILAGPALGIRALAAATALLPPVAVRLPGQAIGRDTAEAIQSGVVLGHLAAIEGLLALMSDELGGTARPTVVLTGGGSMLLGSIDGVDALDPDLLLRGLEMLATRSVATS